MQYLRTMGIEKDIQQTQFRNAYQKAMINLMFTYGWASKKVKQFFASENITHPKYNILSILRGSHPKPLSSLQIRERMLDKMSDIGKRKDRHNNH